MEYEVSAPLIPTPYRN